jgi:hypothetical protein
MDNPAESNGVPNTDKRNQPVAIIALPSRPGENIAMSLWSATQPWAMGSGFHLLDIWAQPCSLLNNNFNDLWAAALNFRMYQVRGMEAHAAGTPRSANPVKNHRYRPAWDKGWAYAAGETDVGPVTDFIMVHSDVCPEPGRWVQVVLEERRRVNADVLSCVIALKDDRGLASTGMMKWGRDDTPHQIKKFSVAECLRFGRSFDAAAAGFPGECLLLNTGLWCCDLTQPWARKLCFRSYDTILFDADGEATAASTGEDWLFSMDCYRLGLRTFATNALVVKHQGIFQYPNSVPWGSHATVGDQWGEPWCVQQPPSWGADEGPLPALHDRPAVNGKIHAETLRVS